MPDDRLAYLRELAAREEALAVEMHELDELARATAGVRERAERIVAVLASEQGERERLTHGVADAEASLGARSVELEHAEQECAEAERDHNDERRAEAVRRLVRARRARCRGPAAGGSPR